VYYKNGLLYEIILQFHYYDNVGPRSEKSISFDWHCIYGNEMWLTENQVQFLVGFCNDLNEDDRFKVYLYKMTNSSVIQKKCKMVGSYVLIHCCLLAYNCYMNFVDNLFCIIHRTFQRNSQPSTLKGTLLNQ
jgi:hypothetical protein